MVTTSADVQDNRIEVIVKGWGKGEESWLIEHKAVKEEQGQGDTILRGH